jgi:hypothetical protein
MMRGIQCGGLPEFAPSACETRSTPSSLFQRRVEGHLPAVRSEVRALFTACDYGLDRARFECPVPRLDTYFIAADEVTWDYTPKGRNLTGTPRSDEGSSTSRSHRSYLKAILREYTDARFRTLKLRTARVGAPRAPLSR